MLRNNGFNLIELMVVVAIIAFLAMIAIPRYAGYFIKARQAEVALNLASLHTAQEAYFATHGHYTTKLSGPGSLNWQPQGYQGRPENERFFYTYGFNIQGAQEGVHYFTGKLKTPKEALGRTYADERSFLVKAAAYHDQNSSPDIWSIDERRSLTQE